MATTSSGAAAAAALQSQASKLIPGDIRMISGCADSQTSADVSSMGAFQLPADAGPGGAGGACSGAFTSIISSSDLNKLTWSELLNGMRKKLIEKRFEQIPQVSSSRQLPLDQRFSIVESQPKRCLFIGINYRGMQGELRGCHNDVEMIRKVVTTKLGMGSSEMRVLRDNGQDESPTKANVLSAFTWLCQGAQAGDSLFLHYSGHGGWVDDNSGDESDKRDETIVPVDYERAGQIKDDELYQKLVLAVPQGVTLSVIMDCCHSGSVFDLPFQFLQTNETDPNAPPPVMGVNPQFNWKKVFDLALKLYKLHQSGAGLDTIKSTALLELQNDPAMKQQLMKAASSAAIMFKQFSGSNIPSLPAASPTAAPSSSAPQAQTTSTSGSTANKPPTSLGGMAKLGASILLAANEAGSQPNPSAGFSSFMTKASRFF